MDRGKRNPIKNLNCDLSEIRGRKDYGTQSKHDIAE